MGRKLLGWCGGLIAVLLVLGIAMTPLEEQPDDAESTASVLSGAMTPVSAPDTQEEPEDAAAQTPVQPAVPSQTAEDVDFVINTNSGKFHLPSCASVTLMNEQNKRFFSGTREEVIGQGYDPCRNCDP